MKSHYKIYPRPDGYLVHNQWLHRGKVYRYLGNALRAMKLGWI